MAKLLREILRLLWKSLQLLFWKWLTPFLGRLFLYALLVTGVVLLVLMVVARL